jgi:hypothetical protein
LNVIDANEGVGELRHTISKTARSARSALNILWSGVFDQMIKKTKRTVDSNARGIASLLCVMSLSNSSTQITTVISTLHLKPLAHHLLLIPDPLKNRLLLSILKSSMRL